MQYLAWCPGFGLHLSLFPAQFPRYFVRTDYGGSLVLSDLSGRDLLKVDVVAATVDLIFLHVPALQLQTQLPHDPLKIPVSPVHLDVVLLQLLLVTDHLEGGGSS